MGNTSAKCKKILKKYWITFKKNEKSLDNSSIRSVFTLFDNDNDGKLNKLEAREYVSYLIDISGIKLQLIDATPYGMSFIQYYEQFINEVVAYLSVGSGKEEGIDMQQLIKQYTNHKLFPLLRFLSQKGWQLHLTRQNLQESSLHEKPQYSVRSERDNSEIEFEFEPDISFQENSLLDLTHEDSLSTGETSEIEINANHIKEEIFPTVNIKVKLPSGEIKNLENIKANLSLVDLKKMCVDSSIVTELCFYYGNELLNEVDVSHSFPLKVVGNGEQKEDERVSITEKMSTSDFKNRLLRTKKNKNQRVKGSKVRAGDITISLEGTLIIPSDGKSYHSPPNLGQIEMFDLAKNELKNDNLNWKKSFSENSSCNKVFLAPLHSHKAFWINFDSTKRYAVKARVGDLNIINGKPWKDGVLEKSITSQNYIVLPQQSFLEGANFGSLYQSQFTFENLYDKKQNGFPSGRILLEFHPENTMDLQIYNSLCLHSPPLDPNKSMSELSIKKGDYVYMRSSSFGKRPAQICDVIDFSKDQDIFLTLKVTKILILVKPTVNVLKTKGPKGTIPISVDLNQPISNLLRFVKESKQFSAPQLNESKDFKFEYKYRFVFKDKELSNNSILYDCGIKEKDVLEMRVELTSVPQSKPSRKRFDSSFNFENSTFEEDLSETSSFVDISETDEISIKSNISRKEIIGGQVKQIFVKDESNIKWNSEAAFTVELQIVDPSEFLKKTGKKVDSHISSKTYEMYGFPSSLVKFESNK